MGANSSKSYCPWELIPVRVLSMEANSNKSPCQLELIPVSVNWSYFQFVKANRSITAINTSPVTTLVLEVPGLDKG